MEDRCRVEHKAQNDHGVMTAAAGLVTTALSGQLVGWATAGQDVCHFLESNQRRSVRTGWGRILVRNRPVCCPRPPQAVSAGTPSPSAYPDAFFCSAQTDCPR